MTSRPPSTAVQDNDAAGRGRGPPCTRCCTTIQLRIRRALGLLGRRGMESHAGHRDHQPHGGQRAGASWDRCGSRPSARTSSTPSTTKGNWGDFTVQDYLRDVVLQLAPEFVRLVPTHYEIKTAELGAAVKARDPVAMQLWKELNDRGLRTTSGVKNLQPRGARAMSRKFDMSDYVTVAERIRSPSVQEYSRASVCMAVPSIPMELTDRDRADESRAYALPLPHDGRPGPGASAARSMEIPRQHAVHQGLRD